MAIIKYKRPFNSTVNDDEIDFNNVSSVPVNQTSSVNPKKKARKWRKKNIYKKKIECKKLKFCKRKTNSRYTNNGLNRKLNRVGKRIVKWVLTKRK